MSAGFIGSIVCFFVIALVVIGLIISRLYTKVDANKAFVRTGAGNKLVVMNGGALVMPLLHSITWVNLQTMRLRVAKDKAHSLVTGDKLRIDVEVMFSVRVSNNTDSIATAAQTLGTLTNTPDELARQIEPKLVDALRAVAATMSFEQLHRQRPEFVQQVKNSVLHDLTNNGLELESVSLTALNQTDKAYFNVDNVLDAEGLTKLTEVTEASKKHINDIEQTNQVAIEQRNLEAATTRAEINRQQAEVRLQNEQQIAAITANRRAEIAATEADGRRRAEEADIEANMNVETRRVEADKSVQEARTRAETTIRIVAQEQAITVAKKSQEEADAQTGANAAKAKAVASEEAVITARETEIANRNKNVAVIAAEKSAQEASIGIVVSAKAEKDAATDRAEARRIDAQGERDAAVFLAEGIKAEGEASAGALLLRNEAMNKQDDRVIEQQNRLALIAALPSIIEQSVAPMKNIESIRIAEVGGLQSGTGGQAGGGSVGYGAAGLPNEAVNAALRYQAHKPVLDQLLASVGMGSNASLNNLVAGAINASGGFAALGNPDALSHQTSGSLSSAPLAAAPEAAAEIAHAAE